MQRDGVVDDCTSNVRRDGPRIHGMESKANGKLSLAAVLPRSELHSAPAVTREEGATTVGGGGGRDESSSSTPHSTEEQHPTEGRRSRAGHAPEASRPHAGLGIGDFAVMGKLGEGGYGTVLLARHKTTHLMYVWLSTKPERKPEPWACT